MRNTSSRCHNSVRTTRRVNGSPYVPRRARTAQRSPVPLLRAAAAAPPSAAAAADADADAQAQAEQRHPNNKTWPLIRERGAVFTTGRAFYRPESAQARDLAVLAAAVHRKQQNGSNATLRVLDAFAGSGVRAARYVTQAGATFVWSNDLDPRNGPALAFNAVCALAAAGAPPDGVADVEKALTAAKAAADAREGGGTLALDSSSSSSSSSSSGSDAAPIDARALGEQWLAAASPVDAPADLAGLRPGCTFEWRSGNGSSGNRSQQQHSQQQQQQQQQPSVALTARVSRADGERLLASRSLAEDYYDLVDVDSFGSEAGHLRAALGAVKHGGMLFLTSTDGMSAGGKRPERALAAWGSYLRALPAPNEQGLRALIGAAVREGAACGLSVTPLFSLYSFHGPVFRAMLRVERRGGAWRPEEFGFVGHCFSHAETRRISFDELGNAVCPVCERERARSNARRPRLVVSGPMWTGLLHDADFVAAMAAEAAARGWDGHAGGGGIGSGGSSASSRTKNAHRGLRELLEVMAEEASARLPPWHVHLDDIARRLTAAPGRAPLIEAMRAAGFEAARCHVERKAVRTNARMEQIVAAAAAAGLAQPRPGLADEEEEGVKQM